MKFFQIKLSTNNKFLSILSPNAIPLVFIIKLIFGIILSLIYTYYYKERFYADTFKYFDDSAIIYNAFFTKPIDFFKIIIGYHNDTPYFQVYYNQMNHWLREYESDFYNDSHTIIRLNAILRFFSHGYYYIHLIFFCFISLSGLVAIYHTFERIFIDKKNELFISIFLIPSVLFWGSGVLKESLLLFGLGFLLYFSFKAFQKISIINILAIGISLIILLFTKTYILISILPCLLAYFIVLKTHNKFILIKYILIFGSFYLIGINLKLLFPNYNITYLLYLKQRDFLGLAEAVHSGSVINIQHIEPTLLSLIMAIPQSLLNTIFRPFLWESKSLLILFAAIENTFIILLLFKSLINFKLSKNDYNISLFFLFFIISNLILIGITTPVTGAIVRYKVPILPFMLMLIFLITKKNKRLTTYE